jgi:predicted TIM-barrel fold metal-dependent hydrolase
VNFANTYGQDKFMFGTDWPVIDPVRAVSDVRDLKFREAPFRKIMGDTARRVFKLP